MRVPFLLRLMILSPDTLFSRPVCSFACAGFTFHSHSRDTLTGRIRSFQIGIEVAQSPTTNRTGGQAMTDLEIYFEITVVVIALAVDLVAIYLY